jgi:dCTP deaminase
MGVLADKEIRRLSVEGWREPNIADEGASAVQRRMIEPFAENEKRPDVISYGVSSYGYDMRIAGEFELMTPSNINHVAIDPKNFYHDTTRKVQCKEGETFVMPAHSFALGVSVERFCIPRDLITICLGKSTYARCGLYVNITPFEPGWEGYPTIELTNPTPRPLVVYPFEGIAQLLFLRAETDLRELADVICEAMWERPLDRPGVDTLVGVIETPSGPDPESLELIGRRVRELQIREHEQRVEAWKRQIPLDGCRITCETSYADKGGKYQGQPARVVHPKVDSEKEDE